MRLQAALFVVSALIAHPAPASEGPVERMGAYQCLSCALGGFLDGIRSGSHGRIHREFAPGRKLCIAHYEYEDGELYVFFRLDWERESSAKSWGMQTPPRVRESEIEGRTFSRLMVDDGAWPDGGAWGVKANSWNAQCRR